jgi:hypothetical protein
MSTQLTGVGTLVGLAVGLCALMHISVHGQTPQHAPTIIDST